MVEVDSGWSWVICLVSFVTQMLTIGFSYAISVYYVEFLDVFEESAGTTSLISSLNLGCICFIGPISSLLVHRWGSRVTMFTGGVVTGMGLFISAFATEFYTVVLTFGVMTGVGAGFAYVPAVVTMGEYFDKYRPVALGLSMLGGGIGTMAYPWVTSALIEHYGWRGAVMITGGLKLHVCVGSMLIMEDKPKTKKEQALEKKAEETTMEIEADKAKYGSFDDKHFEMKEDQKGTIILDKKNAAVRVNAPTTQNQHPKQKLSIIKQSGQLFKDVNFDLILVNSMLFFFGVSIAFTHILSYVESVGMIPSQGTVLLSVIGVAGMAGRLALSTLSQTFSTKVIILYVIAVSLTGISMLMYTMWTSTFGLMFSAMIFGIFHTSFGPLHAECTAQIVGKDLFNFGTGYLMVFKGIGWALGSPVAGMLYDRTKHYENSFYLAAASTVLAAIFMAPTIFLKRKNSGKLLDL